jgi:catalase (peroxidase I)
MVLAGTVAIEDMGGPVLGFCAGRVDHIDNTQSLPLGPTSQQEHFSKCETQGDCHSPLGQNTMGLIYVNPEGPLGQPDPKGAADTIRDVFGRMDMGDRENVALIGGGHTFGKAHGVCPDGPGPKPSEDPLHPWPGKCGSGKGNDTATSGFEGAWTVDPITWDNKYFQYLLDFEWEKYMGPGGHYQWRVKGGRDAPQAPMAHPPGTSQKQDIMMLTTDVALVVDPEYKKYVQEFANDIHALNDAFANVWYKLVTRDMGPVTRCVGPHVPPPQAFQYPLPPPPSKSADVDAVQADVKKIVDKSDSNQALLLKLAWQCASTFRFTDYLGGCNGARIRFSPGKDWKSNEGVVDPALKLLQPIKSKYGNSLTWADLIVLAGNVAAIRAGAPTSLPFCPGRSDATDGAGWEALSFMNAEPPANMTAVLDLLELQGLTPKEFVALSIVSHPSAKLGTTLLKSFLDSKDDGKDVTASAIRVQPDLRYWAEYYIASGDEVLAEDFATAWTKMMTADRFDGPVGNVCFDSDVCVGSAQATS